MVFTKRQFYSYTACFRSFVSSHSSISLTHSGHSKAFWQTPLVCISPNHIAWRTVPHFFVKLRFVAPLFGFPTEFSSLLAKSRMAFRTIGISSLRKLGILISNTSSFFLAIFKLLSGSLTTQRFFAFEIESDTFK